MSRTATARRRGRGAPADGPRATFRQLLPFLFEHKRTLVVVAVLSVFGAATSLVQPLLVGQVIEAVQSDGTIGVLVWLLVGFVIVSSIISGFQHYLLQRTGTAVVYSSRRKLIARILHLPTSEFDARRTGDLVSRVGTDTTLLYAVLTQGLADAVGNVVLFAGALIAMLLIDPVLLLLIVVVIGVSVVVVVALSGRIRTASTAQQEKVGELASGVERAVGSIRTIRASGATERETAAVTERASEAYGIGVRIAKISSLVVPVAGIALQLSLLVVLGVGGFRVAAGAISIAALISFVMFLFLLVMPLASTFGAITSVNQALGALGRIQEVLDLPTETQDDAATAAVNSAHLAAYREHLHTDLGFETELPYLPLNNVQVAAAWDWKHKAPGIDVPLEVPDVGYDLAAAMRRNPALRVLVTGGVYDLATPFFHAENDVARMFLSPEVRANLQFVWHEAGHMSFVDEEVITRMSADLAEFYRGTLPHTS